MRPKLIAIVFVVALAVPVGPAAAVLGSATADCDGTGSAGESGESHKVGDDNEESATLHGTATAARADGHTGVVEPAPFAAAGFAFPVYRPPSTV